MSLFFVIELYRLNGVKPGYFDARCAARDSIMKSRSDDIRGKLAEVEGDARDTWRTAQKLLHSRPPVYQNDAECASLSLAFTQFFVDKINRIRDSITTALQLSTGSHLFVTWTFVGNELSVFSPLTDGDVRRVLSKMLSKPPPLDASVFPVIYNISVTIIVTINGTVFPF